MGIKTLAIFLHLVSGIFALITSEIQTARLKKEIKRYNTPSIFILGGGLVAAVFGTFSILRSLKQGQKIMKQIMQSKGK